MRLYLLFTGSTASVCLAYRSDRAPGSQEAIPLLDQTLGKLSLTHSSSIRGEAMDWRRFTRAFTSVRHVHTQPCGQGANWSITHSRVFPGLQTTGGITPVACLVRLRFGRNLARCGALLCTPARRTIKNLAIKELSRFDDLAGDQYIFG